MPDKHTLVTEPYIQQVRYWPASGNHLLAQFDYDTIVVYQAFNRDIGQFAVDHGHFGGEFNINRMTWLKTSFLWMMHRSGWASKPNQEMILAIWLTSVSFDAILKKAVFSSFKPELYESYEQWQRAVAASNVRLQWDPDYDPSDIRLARRAIQIGLGGKSAAHYAQGGWILHIEDITAFVHEQKENCKPPYTNLYLPYQRVYPVYDEKTAARIHASVL